MPLVAFEGTAYDCGRAYGEWARAHHPVYDRYLRQADGWARLDDVPRRLFERHAPYIPELFLGLRDSGGRASGAQHSRTGIRSGPDGCTSFAVSGDAGIDGGPIAGQTKDVGIGAAELFIALRLRIAGGPTILVLAYPGEVLGLGMWSTGMALFRNALMSTGRAARGLSMEQWGLIALAGDSIGEAVEMAERHGITGAGSHLIMDRTGASCSVEYNEGGTGVVPARSGISTHGNHPEAESTRPYEDLTWEESERENSRYRMHGLWELLDRERGRLTAERAMELLGDHTYYPQGICRHWIAGEPDSETVSAAVVEPSKGLLHVVRGQPCSNRPVTYTL